MVDIKEHGGIFNNSLGEMLNSPEFQDIISFTTTNISLGSNGLPYGSNALIMDSSTIVYPDGNYMYDIGILSVYSPSNPKIIRPALSRIRAMKKITNSLFAISFSEKTIIYNVNGDIVVDSLPTGDISVSSGYLIIIGNNKTHVYNIATSKLLSADITANESTTIETKTPQILNNYLFVIADSKSKGSVYKVYRIDTSLTLISQNTYTSYTNYDLRLISYTVPNRNKVVFAYKFINESPYTFIEIDASTHTLNNCGTMPIPSTPNGFYIVFMKNEAMHFYNDVSKLFNTMYENISKYGVDKVLVSKMKYYFFNQGFNPICCNDNLLLLKLDNSNYRICLFKK